MESLHDKVVKLTAEILNKSWNPEPGKVTPFSSGSSVNDNQISDNHLEHYVQQSQDTKDTENVSSIFNSMNGGIKMENTQYEAPASATTEPDANSEIAMTKSLDGEGTYSTTANTTEQAPSKGETTEPTNKSTDSCPECGKSMTLCECSGMSKSAKCPHCGQDMPMKKAEDAEEKEEDKVEKAADEPESKEEEAKETSEDER